MQPVSARGRGHGIQGAPTSPSGRNTSRAPAHRGTTLGHVPALDGLRGVAVLGVLAYHSEFAWARGGYLGVSAFFTLSGFLITSLLLASQRRGEYSTAEFFVRRVRRLLPVAYVGVLLGASYAAIAADAVSLDRFPADAVSAVLGVANWRLVVEDRSYAELFAGDSPLQHYWSLAVEQQFYVLFALAAVWSFRPGRARVPDQGRRRLTTVFVVALVASVLASVALDTDRAYYGTDTRMAELLIGGLAAVLHDRRPFAERLPGRVLGIVGTSALGAIFVSWSMVDQTSPALHPWILVAHALLTAAAIAAATVSAGALGVLAHPAARAVGRWSYGIYVFHWPIFLFLSPERTGLDGLGLATARVAATLAVTLPVHFLVEEPVRRWTRLAGRPVVTGAALATILVVATAVIPTALIDRRPEIDFAAAESLQRELAVEGTSRTTSTTTASAAEPALPDRPVVSVFGDSTALFLLPGLDEWARTTGRADLVGGYSTKGCGIVDDRLRVGAEDIAPSESSACDLTVQWPEALETTDTDIAVVSIGLWDLVDFRLPGDDERRAVGDPLLDDYLRDELRAAARLLLRHADRVVWLVQPRPVEGTRDASDPVHTRLPRLNELVVESLSGMPNVAVLDLPEFIESDADGLDSLRLRPDGTHFSESTSVEAATWLGPAIVSAAEQGGFVGPDR